MADRPGYDPNFLGLPALPQAGSSTPTLDYLNFTVSLSPERQLAAVTGGNIHGGLLVEIDRKATPGDLTLEDYLLDHAATYNQRLSVFTGLVLLSDDPVYRGVRISLRFCKIAAWL